MLLVCGSCRQCCTFGMTAQAQCKQQKLLSFPVRPLLALTYAGSGFRSGNFLLGAAFSDLNSSPPQTPWLCAEGLNACADHCRQERMESLTWTTRRLPGLVWFMGATGKGLLQV